MNTVNLPHYEGYGEQRKGGHLPGAWQHWEHYKASSKLRDAVNMALQLGRPLLIEGQPGCGKTRLAYSVAYELGWPLHEVFVSSASRARDSLYTFDALRRLYDIEERHYASSTPLPAKTAYITYGPLGQAILDAEMKADNPGRPSVVLIDEIDKSDPNFPNDLLQVLDRFQFDVDELRPLPDEAAGSMTDSTTDTPVDGYGIWRHDALWNPEKCEQFSRRERRTNLPLVIITSNRSRELSDAFLRRCLFDYIEFPDQTDLENIILLHFAGELGIGVTKASSKVELPPLLKNALKRFQELRALGDNPPRWRRLPGTSEMLDWLRCIYDRKDERTWAPGDQIPIGVSAARDLMERPLANLPFLQALIKNSGDYEALQKARK